MTKLAALRRLLASPRDHADMGRIGKRQIYAAADGREKQVFVVRVLRSVLRRVS
jgi:hypothetical protein